MNATWKLDLVVSGRGLMGLLFETEEQVRAQYNVIKEAQARLAKLIEKMELDRHPPLIVVELEDAVGVHHINAGQITSMSIYGIARHEESAIWGAVFNHQLEEKLKRAVQAQPASFGTARPTPRASGPRPS